MNSAKIKRLRVKASVLVAADLLVETADLLVEEFVALAAPIKRNTAGMRWRRVIQCGGIAHAHVRELQCDAH